MDRRNLLKTVGGIGVTASAAGAGVLATSGSAAAAEIGTFDISPSSITTDGGDITGFSVEPEVSIEYDGLDEDAAGVVLVFSVKNPDGSQGALSTGIEDGNPNLRRDVANHNSLGTRAGSFTYDLPAMDVLANSEWTAEDFAEETDGGTKETTVEFSVLAAIRGANGTIDPPGEIRDSNTVTVSVTNEEATGNSGVEGDTGLSGENQEN